MANCRGGIHLDLTAALKGVVIFKFLVLVHCILRSVNVSHLGWLDARARSKPRIGVELNEGTPPSDMKGCSDVR
jgi:hypothetical protein